MAFYAGSVAVPEASSQNSARRRISRVLLQKSRADSPAASPKRGKPEKHEAPGLHLTPWTARKVARSASLLDLHLSNSALLEKSQSFSVSSRVDWGARSGEGLHRSLESTPLVSTTAVFELAETSPRGNSTSRPKHVPILVPSYASIAPDRPENISKSGSFSTVARTSSSSDSPASIESAGASHPTEATTRRGPRHIPIKIPTWAEPVEKRTEFPPRLDISRSVFIDPFAKIASLSPPDMSRPTPDSSRANTMDSNTSAPSPRQLYANRSSAGSNAFLASANSSQSSLVGLSQRTAEYESASASETESTNAEQPSRQASHGPTASQSANISPQPTANTPGSTANLSGLVCNVHRTTGKEPRPLVGATTTILGDKLYVFGGRRLSRTKPQLTSNLYELDLIRRHWTKLETNGDIPAPRYFHSVCALGERKLVCYGGMSPAPAGESGAEGQAEVIVMSDIHIYDIGTRTWMRVSTTDSPQGRYAHCAAILPSSAVFASSNAPMSAVHHNPSGSNPNQGSLGVSLDGTGGAEMIVVGGQDSANHYIEQVSVFNLRSLKWTSTTGMSRSCGAYRSVVTPLTTMSVSEIGAGPHAPNSLEDDDDDEPSTAQSGSPMLMYSNYNFLDVKLELQVRQTDGTLVEKPMQSPVSPPGLRFPNGGVIDNHFVISGTFLTSSKQEYALWALDLRTLTWSRIDAGGSIFSQGSWNRGVLWSRRNCFVILGNRRRSLVDDYNNRRINFSNMCLVELEAFGLYENPRRTAPTSGYHSLSADILPHANGDTSVYGRQLTSAGEELGEKSGDLREMSDMDFFAIDGTRIPVNSRLIARRWGPSFTSLLRESLASAAETDTATLRPGGGAHQSRNSSITITPSVNSNATTLTNNTGGTDELPNPSTQPAPARPRLFYLPHTAPTLYALLHYLYTSTLPSPPHHLATPQIYCSLLQLARPYKIDGLLEAVVEKLHECLDGRNAAAIFNAAAMAAGGGSGVLFAPHGSTRESTIPPRTHSLHGIDALTMNGGIRGLNGLRIDTDMANGRSTRNTLRPGQSLAHNEEDTDEEVPSSATTDASMSESDTSFSTSRLSTRAQQEKELWDGALSAVVGLQKRGLRGLMEGRRLRERGRSDGAEGSRIGLGIA